MRKLFTLFLGILFATAIMAQKPEALLKKASVAPVIGGEVDEVWGEAEEIAIDKKFKTEVPTIGEPGETYWKGLWTDEGLYILLNITDDDYYPKYESGGTNGWQYDKPELYFDANSFNLEDGLGGQNPNNKGNYQIAPDITAANANGEAWDDFRADSGVKYAFMINDPNYVAEYFIPFKYLKDADGIMVDKTAQIGFDVTIIDNDAPGDDNGRRRGVWANEGAKDESWNNMDDAGIITLDGAEAGKQVESIALTGGTITTDNGTLQIASVVLPEDAESKDLKWSIAPAESNPGRATIDEKGVVTAILDGVVVVNASSTDGSFVDADPVEVTISGQNATIFELSYIKNGDFTLTNENGTPKNWTVPADGVVIDGVMNFGPSEVKTNQWDYTLLQTTYVPFALKDEEFVLSFKAWADEPRTLPLVLEDAYNDGAQWDTYANSGDAGFSDKTWTVDLTTEPTVYTLNLTFAPMQATTQQNMNFQVGLATPRIHLDSMYLISKADMGLVPAVDRKLETFRIYPNPADTKLNIVLTTENTTVAIYNSVGVKMEEVVVPGTTHTFDVSRYTRGLYFVKANNSVMKFVK